MSAHIVNSALGSLWIPVLTLITAISFLSGLKRFGVEVNIGKVLGLCLIVSWILGTVLYLFFGLTYNNKIGSFLGATVLFGILFWGISLVAGKNFKKRSLK